MSVKDWENKEVRKYGNDFIKEKKYCKSEVKRLIKYIESKNISIGDICNKEVQRYYNWLKKQNYAETTIKRTIEKARSFYRYLISKGIVRKNPFGDGTRSNASVSKFTHTQKKLWYGFSEYEKQRGVKAIDKSASSFTPFFQFLKDKGIHYLKVNEENAHDFETFLANIKNADGSIHYTREKVMAIMSMIRRFYNYLKDTGKIITNPLIKKRKKREVKRQRQNRFNLSIPAEMQKLIDEFLEERTTGGYRDKNGMRKQVKKLFIYLNEYDLDFADMKVKQAQDYQAWLIEDRSNNGKKYSSGSICNFNKGAVRFYDFLKKKGIVHSNPFLEIRRKRVKKRLPRNILKEDEIIKLLSELEHFDEVEGTRNQKTKYKVHVIAELMYSTSLRAGEVARIKESDIDFLRGSINVIDVKDGHEKTVFLNEYAKNILKIYVSEMKDLVLNENNDKRYIFGMKAGRLSQIVNEELRRITKKLHLPVITSHSFRHAVGYHFLRAGCDIRYIQEILGHKSIHNTEIYTKVDKEDLQKVLDEYHPRKWRKI